MYVYAAESLWCIPKTNMALYINCTPIETSKRNVLEVSAENSADGLSLGAVGQGAAPDTGPPDP